MTALVEAGRQRARPLSRMDRMLLWARLLERLEEGEALLTDDQFERALLEEYARLTGAAADEAVRQVLRRSVTAVNSAYPQTYRAFGLQNGLNQAFENNVRRLNWDARRVEEKGVRAVYRFSRQGRVRALLQALNVPSKFNAFSCVNRTLGQLTQEGAMAQEGEEKAVEASLAPLDPTLLPDLREAVATGLVDSEETTRRLQEQQQVRQQIEAREMGAVPQRLDVYVEQGLLTAADALHYRALREIQEQERFREISRREAAEMRAQVLSREGRKELEEKVKVAVSLAVDYLEIFEALRRIDPKYDEALRFLVQHKYFVAAAEHNSGDEDLVLTALQYNPGLAERVCDIMERRPQEIRFMAVRLPPYKGVIGPQMERVGNWTVEEHFVDDLRTLNTAQMSERLHSADSDMRARVAADICCLVHLVDHVIRPTEFRRQVRLLEFGKLLAQWRPSLEQLYHSAHDFDAGRRRAEMYVNRSARRAFNDPTPRELAAFDRAAESFLLAIEVGLHEQNAQTQTPGAAETAKNSAAAAAKAPKRGWDPEKRPVSEKARGRTRVKSDPENPGGFVVEKLDGPPQKAAPAAGSGGTAKDAEPAPLRDAAPVGSAERAPDPGAPAKDTTGPVQDAGAGGKAASGEAAPAGVVATVGAVARTKAPTGSPALRAGDPEVQIARIEVRVGGSYREIRAKIMPDPENRRQYVIAGRDPRSGELVPQTLRGSKRIVEKNRQGVWQITTA